MYQVGEHSGWCCSSKPGHIAWQAPPWRLRRGVGCSKVQGVEPGLQLHVVYASTQYCYLEGLSLDGGGVRCHYPTQSVCHYLGIAGWNLYYANFSFFVSTFQIWSRQYHALQTRGLEERTRWQRLRGTIEGCDRRNRSCSNGRYTGCNLAAGGLSEEGGPQGQFGMECLICYSTHNRIILVLEGPNAIIDAERVPARVNR